jgi:hypothetical protein
MLGARRFADDDSQTGQKIHHQWYRERPMISVSCYVNVDVHDIGSYLQIVRHAGNGTARFGCGREEHKRERLKI